MDGRMEENTVYELKYTHYDKLDKSRLSNYLRQLNYYIEMTNASRRRFCSGVKE